MTVTICFSVDSTAGGGGKGTWGKLLAADGQLEVDRNDPNYNSEEVFGLYLIQFSFECICIAVSLLCYLAHEGCVITLLRVVVYTM